MWLDINTLWWKTILCQLKSIHLHVQYEIECEMDEADEFSIQKRAPKTLKVCSDFPRFLRVLCIKNTASCRAIHSTFQNLVLMTMCSKLWKKCFFTCKFLARYFVAPCKLHGCASFHERSKRQNCGGSFTFESLHFVTSTDTPVPRLLQWRPNIRHPHIRYAKKLWQKILRTKNFYFSMTRKTPKMKRKSLKKYLHIFVDTKRITITLSLEFCTKF